MSRFIAGHFWLVVAVLLVVGREDSGGRYHIFGWGAIEPPLYWLVTLTAMTIGFVSLILSRDPEAADGSNSEPAAARDDAARPR